MTLRVLAVALLLFALTSAIEVAAVETGELDSMLNVLRARGYDLFSNAIATSDLILEVLTGKSFTFFAPTDSALFSLDMTDTASDYIATLRCHIIPFRISLADLRSFPSGSNYFPTLFSNHRTTIRIRRLRFMTASDNFITVDRVGIAFPGLFYSRNIAVHGLGGIINCNSHQGSPTDLQPLNQPLALNISSHVESPSSENVLNGEAPSPPPGNLFDDHSFDSSPPVVSQNLLPSPSPTSREIPNDIMESPAREPPAFGGSAPANSPELLPSQLSLAYDLWSEIPTPAATFVSTTEPPVAAPEFSENDDPMSFPPASMMTRESKLTSLNEELSVVNLEEEKSELRDHLPVIWPEDLDGIMETLPDESQPTNKRTFDCTGTSTTTTSMLCSTASNNSNPFFPFSQQILPSKSEKN